MYLRIGRGLEMIGNNSNTLFPIITKLSGLVHSDTGNLPIKACWAQYKGGTINAISILLKTQFGEIWLSCVAEIFEEHGGQCHRLRGVMVGVAGLGRKGLEPADCHVQLFSIYTHASFPAGLWFRYKTNLLFSYFLFKKTISVNISIKCFISYSLVFSFLFFFLKIIEVVPTSDYGDIFSMSGKKWLDNSKWHIWPLHSSPLLIWDVCLDRSL